MLFIPEQPFLPAVNPAPEDAHRESLWFPFSGQTLLVGESGEKAALLSGTPRILGDLPIREQHFLGYLDGVPCIAADLGEGAALPPGMRLENLRRLFEDIGPTHFIIAGRALQVVQWSKDHHFCGRCATPLASLPGERARQCPACKLVVYPRIAPAIIVGIRRGDQILLARSPRFPKGIYSVLAGFCEAGESLEETVHREVWEETGIRIANLRYFSSQSWPFPNSLMIGFLADYAGGDITIDGEEIEDAQWFGVENLPVVSSRISISRAIIERLENDIRNGK